MVLQPQASRGLKLGPAVRTEDFIVKVFRTVRGIVPFLYLLLSLEVEMHPESQLILSAPRFHGPVPGMDSLVSDIGLLWRMGWEAHVPSGV